MDVPSLEPLDNFLVGVFLDDDVEPVLSIVLGEAGEGPIVFLVLLGAVGVALPQLGAVKTHPLRHIVVGLVGPGILGDIHAKINYIAICLFGKL